jgi:hypothetical protein
MKMNYKFRRSLREAIERVGGMPPNATERQRWDALWKASHAGVLNLSMFYSAGFDDDHIDTALRDISRTWTPRTWK